MAMKVRGITIDIGADTTGLNKALTATNKEIKSTQSQLKDVEKLLKLDPKNVELLAQKQKLLAKATDETKGKIKTLQDALQKMKDQGIDEASDAFQAMQRELIETEQQLKKYTSQTKESTKETKKSAEGYTVAKDMLAQLAVEGIKMAVNALKELGKELVAQVTETAEYGDNIDKMSQKIGISAEEYQKLGYAFERSGANIDSLQGGMKTLKGVLVDAANGSEQAQAKLAAIGLTAEDLAGKSSDAQLNMVINALQGMGEGAERTAAATDLLGKSATDLGPLLNMSAEDLEALKQEAEDYGMVMSNEAVKQSAAFDDSMTRLEGTVTGLRNRLVGQLLPGITKVTDGLAKMMSGQGGTDDIAEGIGEFLNQIVQMLPQFTSVLIDVVKKLLELIVQNLPMIIDTVFTLLDQIIETVLDLLPDLIPKLIDGIALLISRILEHLPEIISEIVKALPEIISGLIQALITNLPLVIDGLITFVGKIVEQLPMIMEAIFVGILQAVFGMGEDLKDLGKNILNGLIWILNKAIDGINIILTPLRAIIMAVGNLFGAKWSMNNVAIPHIPQLAKGGILTQGTAIVGERGPELLSVYGGRAIVQPLTNNNYNNNMGGVNITINAQPGQSATDIADAVSIALAEQYARTKAVYV